MSIPLSAAGTPSAAPRRSTAHTSLNAATIVAVGFAVCLAQIGLAVPATLNGTFQTVLHPTGASQLDWISDCTLLPIAALELTFGVLGDLFGRKKLLVGGARLLLVGEIISGTTTGIAQMYVGQIIAGLGSATLFPTTLAIIASGSRTHASRARMIALWAALLSTGNFIAPMLGGLTATYGSWRTAFWIIAGLAAADAVFSYSFATDSRSPEGRSLDVPGQVTIGVALFALLYAVIEGPTAGWGSPVIIASFAVAAALLVAFVVIETRVADPLLRMDLFRNRAFALASAVTVLGMFSFLGTAYAISIRMEVIQHQSAMRTAFAFILLSGLTIFLLPLTSFMMARYQARWILGGGFLLMAVGQFLASALPITRTSLPSLILPMGLVGVGFSFAVSSVTATVVNTVPKTLAGMAAATTSMVRDFGFAMGPALIGAIALSRAAGRFHSDLAGDTALAPVRKAAEEAGPVASNSVPPDVPFSKAAPVAVKALDHGYSLGFLIVGIAALVCCVVTVAALGGKKEQEAEVAMIEAEAGPEPEPAA
ncbi:Major Facilitator Superfamily protein [Actinacidiphila yanglinensis]|uniref:Major Facilitator Superfamily protein n=1 Tax=Actinacidiphila yanglinensis TaxID=310779 RepID=A0A1H6DPH3_9ACTN|nr:MFS transporter [Actinacidiphila yanglinensis]SEG87180.1 Major Facilitator Superfamily protein [Actinacidiphila yanglinensis]